MCHRTSIGNLACKFCGSPVSGGKDPNTKDATLAPHANAGEVSKPQLFLLENLVIAAVQFIIGEMRVTLCDLNVGMTRQFLRQLEIAGAAQYRRHKIMTERMGRDASFGLVTERLLDALLDDVAARGRGDGFDLFASAFVVPGKEGQGCQWFS